MSHFYGTVKGNRGEGTRAGSKDSGMETYCASWNGAIRCVAWHDKVTSKDMVRVEKTTWQEKVKCKDCGKKYRVSECNHAY